MNRENPISNSPYDEPLYHYDTDLDGALDYSKELLAYWFENPERHAQIWLNEVADKSNPGQNILNKLEARRKETSGLPRTAFKMATGAGKTVVMAALILYHFLNRQEYRNDTRFADNFLILALGITIRDRLSVLFVDVKNIHSGDVQDYYHQRGLVPPGWRKLLPALNRIFHF